MKNAYGLPRKLVGRVFDEQGLPTGVTSPETAAPVFLERGQAGRLLSSLGLSSDVGSVLVIPLLLRDERIGSVSFHYRSPGLVLGNAETDFARRLGTLLSFAFESARLYATQREIADTLQAALLTVPRRIPGIEFGYLYRSATTSAAVGGDFYDIFELDGGRVGILLGDVSGKGVQAATLTALVKNTIRALSYENGSPAAVVGKTSAVVLRSTPPSIFVTIMFCILDTASGRLAYCSAGHTRGIVKKRDGDVELLEVGSPLAGAFESVAFEDGETVLDEGDALVLYTDGVTEARRDGTLFGEERLVGFVRRMEEPRPKRVPRTIFDEVLRFAGGNLSDDVAIVAVARSDKG
jgi:serine phosphatase RsbU (regulator of sigma subunit)